MFKVIGREIQITRGDMLPLNVNADNDGEPYEFKAGDIVGIKVFEKGDVENVVLDKRFTVTEPCFDFNLDLLSEDTRIGDYIKKPVQYWYEIELNPGTPYVNTIVGYDKDDGPALFWLLPEGGNAND